MDAKAQLLVDMLTLASTISVFVLALVQLVKETVKLPKNIIPLVGFGIGLIVGALAYPFTDFSLVIRLWAGGIAGLAATGLFELAFNRRDGETKNK